MYVYDSCQVFEGVVWDMSGLWQDWIYRLIELENNSSAAIALNKLSCLKLLSEKLL